MKKCYILLAALFLTGSIFAQAPVNDDCSGLIDLGTAPICPQDTFTNINATPSDIGSDNFPACFNAGIAKRDVWFSFTCPDTLFDFRITLTGAGNNTIRNPEFALYRGDCQFNGLAELLCVSSQPNKTSVYMDAVGLTPGVQYFIRVSDYSATAAPNWGRFTLCVGKIPPISLINEGGSSLCEGTLYDSGGPDNDYGPGENNTFVICPTEPTKCLTFTLDYYNIEPSNSTTGGESLTFYNGSTATGTPLEQISGAADFASHTTAGGGVCFQVQASSGCMTIVFKSDGSVEDEGWKGHWFCSPDVCPATEKITVNKDITSDSIVAAVETAATKVTVTSIKCPSGAYGTFKFPAADNQLGLEKGLLLTSGDAANAIGPNNSTSSFFGYNNFGDGDPDLDYLSQVFGDSVDSHNACVVELDVFAATDELSFEYVFGSEEYPEYVNTPYNDIFAFLVSGPGIVGDPGLGGAKNIAVIPGSNTPVQINSVNNLLNWQYFRNNQPYDINNNNKALQYDGLTSDSLGGKKSLTARTPVIPCNTYHLKLAVADRQDEIYDSGVFISDIKGGTPDLKVQFASGIQYFIENCSGVNDKLLISLSDPLEQPASFVVTISGTATLGVDYTLDIPNVITFLPGQTQLAFPIVPIVDNLIEGTETVIISLSNNFGCGTVVYKQIVIDLKDNAEVNVIGGDTLLVCAGTTYQLNATGAVDYFWAPPGAVSNPFIANPTITPTQDQWLMVTGTIASCVDSDSVYIKIVDPSVKIAALSPTNICLGGSVQLQAQNNTGGVGLMWSPPDGLSSTTSEFVTATPTVSTVYTASITISGCVVTDTVAINVDTLFFPKINFIDTLVCQNYPVQLANVLTGTTQYAWSPTQGLSDPTSSGPIALPDQSTIYTLTATSAHGYCSNTAVVQVHVTPADINILDSTYHEICLGDTLTLNTTTTPSGAIIHWSPGFPLSATTGATVKAFPDESVTVLATYAINGCTVYDSVHIRVDSLPYSAIYRVQDKTIYCPGDTVYLLSKTYEPADFHDITSKWENAPGELTPVEKWNMVITATKTDTFYRVSVNHACYVRDSVIVPVGIPPTLTITALPDHLCPGEQAQITLTVSPPNTSIEWMDDPTLSCKTCLNPIANPTSTTTYTVSTPNQACPSSKSITVPVYPTPTLSLSPQHICSGASVVLNGAPQQPGVDYQWTSDPVGYTSTLAQPSVHPPVNTTYHVVASGQFYCTTQGDVFVEVTDYPDLSATFAPAQLCVGETAHLVATVNPPTTVLQWQGPGLNCTGCSPNQDVTPGSTATYIVSTPGLFCVAHDTLTVPVLPYPKIQLASDTKICAGETVFLNALPAQAGVSYTWTSNPTGYTSTKAQPPAVKPPQTTTYYLVAGGPAFCQIEDSVTITVVDYPDLSISPVLAPLCPGDSVHLNATVTPPGTTVLWQGPGLSSTSSLNPVAKPTTTSTYYLSTPGQFCVAHDSVTVTVLTVPVVQLIPATEICPGASIVLNTHLPENGVQYVWTDQTGALVSTSAQPSVSPTQQTTYKIHAEGANTCPYDGSVTITVASATIDAGLPQTVCAGSTVTLHATTNSATGSSFGTINWQPGNLTGATVNVTPSVPTTYTASVQYGPNNGCPPVSDAVKIDFSPPVSISKIKGNPETDTVCLGVKLGLKVTTTPSGASLVWKQDGVVIPGLTADSINYVPGGEGKTVLSAVATNAAGCKDSSDISYFLRRCFEMPNVFTPGGDQLNDTFGPLFFGGNASIVYFKVFDRWGQKVFDGNDEQKAWDGKIGTKEAPSDVYVYQIKIRYANGVEEDRKGQVTLLR